MTKVSEEFCYVTRDELYESPLNPRRHFDEEALAQLAESVAASGLLEALVVRRNPNGAGQFEIGSGHRRFRAAGIAGVERIPVRIMALDDRGFVELLQVSNLQRDDLHPLEEAEGFKQLMETCGYDVAQIAARIGRSTRYVYDSLTLLKLTKDAKALFADGRFERGHAIELARLRPADQERALASERSGGHRLGGLFTPELVDEGGLELDDEEPRKPVSVREFKRWVDDEVRFKPADADPMLFPETVGRLSDAAEEKEKVVEITYEWQIPGGHPAREADGPKIKTARAWKSAAPGIPGPDHLGNDGTPCEYAITGVVVIGDRRGQAFKVCLAKEKCKTHWAAWQRERARRKKQDGAAGSAAATDRSADRIRKEQERWERQRRKEEEDRKRWKRARPAVLKAIEARIGKLAITANGPIVTRLKRELRLSGPIKGATADALLRALAMATVRQEFGNEYALRHVPEVAKGFGVNAVEIRDEVAPADKPAAKKRATTKRATKKTGRLKAATRRKAR